MKVFCKEHFYQYYCNIILFFFSFPSLFLTPETDIEPLTNQEEVCVDPPPCLSPSTRTSPPLFRPQDDDRMSAQCT